MSDYELRVHLQEAGFQAHARAVLRNFEAYLNEQNTWGRKNAPELLPNPVAYFSAEFGLHESLPVSAGVTLYVAASDLIPEVNHEPGAKMALLVFLGVAIMLALKLAFQV